LVAKREWQARGGEASGTGGPSYGQHWGLLYGEGGWARGGGVEGGGAGADALPQARCVVVGSGEAGIARRYEGAVLQALEVLQRIVQDKPKDDVLVQLVVRACGEDALFGGLSGLLKTARLEQPRLKG